MIKNVVITNDHGEKLTLTLMRPEQSGFVVKNITGIGPGAAYINTSEYTSIDGSEYNSARAPERNITIELVFHDAFPIEESRQKTYKYFPLKKQISITIESDYRKAEIYGYVESNEPNIFEQQENTLISIICPDRYFYSTGGTGWNIVQLGSDLPNFEFPFSNESLDTDMIEVGVINILTEGVVRNDGDTETGVNVDIYFDGSIKNPSLINGTTGESMKISTDKLRSIYGLTIKQGDHIFINTTRGSKSVKLMQNGKDYNILNCLEKNYAWFSLVQGDNLFAYTADSGVENMQVTFRYRTVYEGV